MADDLINSAVTFLQDPKVADAPIAKRIAFLESKGLTQDQVTIALQKAQQQPSTAPTTASSAPYTPPIPYASYQQQAPPPLPQRDWRDWFIMAVVSGGFSWAAYTLAKRYVIPLIQPPTPTHLEEDKDRVKAQFDQVSEMLSILQSDAAATKEQTTEQARKIDAALQTLDAAVSDMQDKTARRETDIRRLGLEIDQIRELIPKSMEAVKQAQTDSLNDLNGELRSLKTLLQNRIKATQPVKSSSEDTLLKPKPATGIPAWQMAAAEKSQQQQQQEAVVEK